MKRTCTVCAAIATQGTRCDRHAYSRDNGRKARNKRKAFTAGRSCSNCGSTTDLTVDHVIALANGGADHESNWDVLCRSCNSRKAHH